jgi:hypothetical protein
MLVAAESMFLLLSQCTITLISQLRQYTGEADGRLPIMKRGYSAKSRFKTHIPLHCSQFTPSRLLLSNNSHLRSAVTQANLPALHAGHKPHTLPTLSIFLTSPPHLRDQTVTRLNRRCEPRRKLSQIRWIATAKQLQQAMSRGVPRV